MSNPKFDENVRDYAKLACALAHADEAGRQELLETSGLDEEGFSALEDRWNRRLAEADSCETEHGVPPLLLQFSEAFAEAQAQTTESAELGFEHYVEMVRALSSGRDVAELLTQRGLTLSAYLQAHKHWTLKMAQEPALAARFAERLSG